MNFTSASISSTYQYVIHVETGSYLADGTGSLLTTLTMNTISASVLTFNSSSADRTVGSVELSSGAATVSSSAIRSNSLIFLTGQDAGSNFGALYVNSRTVDGFTINSTNVISTQLVAWLLIQQRQ